MTGALALLAALILEDGRRWADAATDWQWEDARAVLDQLSGVTSHFLTRPRGGSKTSDLAGILLAVLLEQVPAGARCYAVAADRDQGRLLLDALAGFVRRTPGLASLVTIGTYRVTVNATGAVLEVLAADGPSAYGLLPHFVVVDEVAQWPSTPSARQVWEAVVSSVPKVKGCRLVVLTSAGDPVHWSHKVLAGAVRSERWRVHEVPGPVPWIAPEALEEQRALLTEAQFARLHLNQWTAAEDRLVRPEDLAACMVLDGPQAPHPGVVYVAGLDVGLVRDRTVLAVCHVEPVGDVSAPAVPVEAPPTLTVLPAATLTEAAQRAEQAQRSKRSAGGARRPWERRSGPLTAARVVCDQLLVWQGSSSNPVSPSMIEEAVRAVHQRYRLVEMVFDPWQMKGTAERLERDGLACVQFNFSQSSVGRLALTLHTLLRSRALALPADDAGLADELEHVRLREVSSGVLRMDHDSDRHDDRAIALALAANRLVERWQNSGPMTPVRRLRPVTMDERRVEDLRLRRLGRAPGSRQDGTGGVLGQW